VLLVLKKLLIVIAGIVIILILTGAAIDTKATYEAYRDIRVLKAEVAELNRQLEITRADFKQLEIRQNVSDNMNDRLAVVEGRKRGEGL
jgi:outer membrane murein-binding lipoprotein Lpp